MGCTHEIVFSLALRDARHLDEAWVLNQALDLICVVVRNGLLRLGYLQRWISPGQFYLTSVLSGKTKIFIRMIRLLVKILLA